MLTVTTVVVVVMVLDTTIVFKEMRGMLKTNCRNALVRHRDWGIEGLRMPVYWVQLRLTLHKSKLFAQGTCGLVMAPVPADKQDSIKLD